MSDEHGYQRSGKKCREKFENLYKYYKKTKEGKAGRQDGKHYRFFRQLEALYGESSNVNNPSSSNIPEAHFGSGVSSLRFHTNFSAQANHDSTVHSSQKLCDSLSLSNTSELDTSSSEDNDLSTATLDNNDSTEKRRKRRGGWKTKIKDFIDSQMKKLIERQEAWLEKLTKTLEQKERERVIREEEWRKGEAARIDREHKFWAKERAWIEARDAALMEALEKLAGKEVINVSSPDQELIGSGEIQKNQSEIRKDHDGSEKRSDSWSELEVSRLMQLRSGMESKFQQSGCMEQVLWEEIAAKMACLGSERSPLMCREKWGRINNNLIMKKTKEGNKKRKENNSRSNCTTSYNFQGTASTDHESIYTPGGCGGDGGGGGGGGAAAYCEMNEQNSPAAANSNVGNAVNESCFRFFMGDGENIWENYGLKLNNGDQTQ